RHQAGRRHRLVAPGARGETHLRRQRHRGHRRRLPRPRTDQIARLRERHQRTDRGARRGARHHQLPARGRLLQRGQGRGLGSPEPARRALPFVQRNACQGRRMMARTIRVATDVGGTFTDLVCFETDHATGESRVITAKSDTTPPNFEAGVLNVLEKGGVNPRSVDFLAHGTTVVINALTERNGVKVGLITTEGFRDTLEIARGNRPDFFNLHYEKPKPFVPRYLRRELPGRVSYKGVELKSLDLSPLPAIIDDFSKEGVEAVAICFLHSYANTSHEQAALA